MQQHLCASPSFDLGFADASCFLTTRCIVPIVSEVTPRSLRYSNKALPPSAYLPPKISLISEVDPGVSAAKGPSAGHSDKRRSLT